MNDSSWKEVFCMNIRLSKICPFLSILSTKFVVIVYYTASTDSTVALNPHKNLPFCLFFFLSQVIKIEK